jgi:glycosyltransferase involved in cell wall biosynthesis
MKIAILNLTSGSISGGYKKYINNVIPRLVDNLEVKSVLCALPTGIQLKVGKNIHIIQCKPYKPFNFSPDKKLLNSINQYEPDIIFCPVERPYQHKNIPVVTMLQNMEPFVKRSILNTFKINLKLEAQKLIGRKALKGSDGIICISNFVKYFLINDLNIPKRRTSLIYHGIGIYDANPKRMETLPKGFNHNFIFTAGSIRPARGLEDLINAMGILKRNGVNKKLLIAGSISHDVLGYVQYLKKLIIEKELSDSILFVNELNQSSMKWCYINSDIFVMTSRVESFGIVAVEAMLNECLIISSLSPCLPEVFGDVATYYKSGDHNDLSEKIALNLNMSNHDRLSIKLKAKKRSQLFSWDICAARTVDFFSKIIERHNNENR